MTTDVLQDIISRCHHRRENPLKQRKTISVHRLCKGLPYRFTAYCAHRYPVVLQDLEAAGISFMPIGQAPGADRPPRHFGGERFLKRQQAIDWQVIRWRKSWGIQVYTGTRPRRAMGRHGTTSTLSMKPSVPHLMLFLLVFKRLLMPLRTRW